MNSQEEKRHQILIVDDNPRNLQILGIMLKAGGYRTAVAQSGAEALAFVQQTHPDLIILDVMMPEMDGFTACRALKKDPATSYIPVIFVTALSDTEDKLKGFSAGGSDYIAKPFVREEVLARVQVILDRISAEQERQRLANALYESRKKESLQIMAAGVAHNFNNILMTLMGSLEMARERIGPGHAAMGPMKMADDAARRAATLGKLMLAYVGQRTGLPERIDIAPLAQFETDELTRRPDYSGFDISADCQPAWCMVDKGHISQLVQNLLENAMEAVSENNGSITVRTGAGRFTPDDLADDLAGSSPKHGEYAYVTVSDTGPGMDPSTREKIFDPFFSTRFTGRGLGLPVVMGVVQSAKGALTVSSSLGNGTSVTAYIPATDIETS